MGVVRRLGFSDSRMLNYKFGGILFIMQSVLITMSLLLSPTLALRKASTLNLASMRIYTAELQLWESGKAATVLEEHCRAELEAVKEGLQQSSRKVVVDRNDARRELVRVDDFLEMCSQNMSLVVNSQASDLLTPVEQSVAFTENLIDQSEITKIAPPSPETLTEQSNELMESLVDPNNAVQVGLASLKSSSIS